MLYAEARANGKVVIRAEGIKDPRFGNGEWVKKQWTHDGPNGKTTVHFMENTTTKETTQFKDKNGPTGP